MDLYTADFWFSSAVIAEKLQAVWWSFSYTTLWFFIHYNFHYLHNDAIEEAFGFELSNWLTLRESTPSLLLKFSRCVVSRAAGNTAETRFSSWKQSKVVFLRKLIFESQSQTLKNLMWWRPTGPTIKIESWDSKFYFLLGLWRLAVDGHREFKGSKTVPGVFQEKLWVHAPPFRAFRDLYVI